MMTIAELKSRIQDFNLKMFRHRSMMFGLKSQIVRFNPKMFLLKLKGLKFSGKMQDRCQKSRSRRKETHFNRKQIRASSPRLLQIYSSEYFFKPQNWPTIFNAKSGLFLK